MMQIRVRKDSVEIEGYVNAVERKSKPLWSRIGRFVERICKGAFKRALERNHNVRILLNHDPTRDLGGTADGNLELNEDSIGLHARATITDPEVVKKARDGDLVGWSFGFYDREVEQKTDEDGLPLRNVRELDLEEVSILDNTTTPAYDGTLVAVRADESSIFYGESFSDGLQIREEQEEEVRETPEEVPEQQETVDEIKPNYDEADSLIADMKS
jgi:HK97 family phage prohead protease